MLLALLAAVAVKAAVSQVTVYSDRARVVRTAEVPLQGSMRAELPLLPDTVDTGSIRLEAKGAEVQKLDIQHVQPDEFPLTEARELLAKLEAIDDQLALLADEQSGLQQHLAAIRKIEPQVKDEPLKPRPKLNPKGWAEAQGLSVQLQVKGPADVSGDGTPARLFVASTELQAAFAWKTVPRQVPFVFRVADLVNTAPFPLLPGEIDLFRRGAYLGRVPLERVAEGARFHMSFGIEEGVKVKRFVLEEIARDEGIFKSAQRFRYAYRFEVENHLQRPEQIELAEQVPVSELSDVEVALEDGTTKGFTRKAEDGIVSWKLSLAPGEKRELQLAFHVDVPKDYATGF